MGTNYYYYSEGPCPTCGTWPEGKHIGKSSAGWCFTLHVYPDENINDLDDWKLKWKQGAKIRNEYNEIISMEEMCNIIENRSWSPTERIPSYYDENEAIRGPNNLMRHKIGRLCIKHGSGTWDCLVGDFS